MQRHKRRIIRPDGKHFLRFADDGLEVAIPLAVMNGDAALLAVEQELHAGQPALKLADPGDGANGVECFRGHALHVLPLGDGEDQTVGRGQRRFDGAQRSRSAQRRSAQ